MNSKQYIISSNKRSKVSLVTLIIEEMQLNVSHFNKTRCSWFGCPPEAVDRWPIRSLEDGLNGATGPTWRTLLVLSSSLWSSQERENLFWKHLKTLDQQNVTKAQARQLQPEKRAPNTSDTHSKP